MGKCLEVNQGVMLKVALKGLLEDPLGEKEGRRDTKMRSMSRRKGNMALEKGHFKHTGQFSVLRGVVVSTRRTRNLNERMRNWSVCVGW